MHEGSSPLNIDLHTLESKNLIVLSSQLKRINAQRDPSSQIISINPDTLYFDFTNRIIKRIPVKLMLAINYQRQFAQADNIEIKPEYITLSGPANRIQHISVWPTDSLKLSNIDESVNTRVRLRQVNDGSMVIYPKSVQVNIPVDEFTEKTLEIPVKLINNHNYDDVKIFPQKVKVTFTTSLNRYAQTTEDFFEANADLDLWRKRGYKTLPVVIFKSPTFTKIVKVEPQNIDFIIRK